VENQSMKVLFVATAYKRHEHDIITPWMVQLIQRLRQHKVAVSVFTSSYKGLKNQIIDNVPVYRFRYFLRKYEYLTHEQTAVDRFGQNWFNVFLSLFYVIFGTIALVRLVRIRHFDIVHINWPFPHIIFGLAAKAVSRTRILSTFYGLEIRWLKKKFPFLVKPFAALINRSDMITAISRHTAAELDKIVNKKIEIIPFSISISEKKTATADHKKIIFVGRHVERKGVDVLIKAFHRVHKTIPHDLIIIGDGPEKKTWENLADKLGISRRVTFTGWISDKKLTEYYRNCSFFVLPAIYDKHGDTEGLGVVMIEAMSFAKPVIASHAGGITDVVDHGENGLLVPPGDVQALAQAISTLAKDTRLSKKMGRRAKELIDERFNWDKIVKSLISLYETGEK
jgi:glycosyltransferase involved in cell wall biosynthesis